MICCIGIGQLNKNLYFLLLATLFMILSNFIYGIEDFKNIFGEKFFAYESILKNHTSLQSLMKYFGIAALSFLLYRYENLQVKNKSKNNNDNNSDSELKNKKPKFFLIHNDIEDEIDNTKYIAQILFIGFLLGFIELIDEFFFLVAPPDTDFWTFEIFFASFFMGKIFKTKLYKHQIFAMIFIIFFCSPMKAFLLYKHYEKDNYNLYQLFIVIPAYLLIIFIRSYVYTKIKWLIDIRYFTISKILLIYGLFGFFLSIIINILANTNDYLEKKYGNKTSQSYSINWWKFIVEVILIILYMCLNFGSKFYFMKTLKFFSPIHVLVITSFYYIIIKFIKNINELFNLFHNDTNTDTDTDKNQMIICSFLINIFSFFGYLVFVELIELRCFGCNYNLKKNIIDRCREDHVTNIELMVEGNQLDDSGRTYSSESFA